MTEELERALYALRAELERQAQAGNATYNGVATDGLDGLEGYFACTRPPKRCWMR